MAQNPEEDSQHSDRAEQSIRPESPSHPVPSSPHDEDVESGEDRQMKVAMKMVGAAMVFIGFIQVFLSASTGAEITVFPIILYFMGLALWAYSSVRIPVVRYLVMGGSTICALAFFHFGEVLFWHKYVIYWGTIALVVYFMFQTPKKPSSGP
ncbi:MAG: hypothetical protein D6704_02050 [Nitrospirae bacterium]|nr:MAG: hypothetical protein D6704_02050 [Nitrospirota bacterium]